MNVALYSNYSMCRCVTNNSSWKYINLPYRILLQVQFHFKSLTFVCVRVLSELMMKSLKFEIQQPKKHIKSVTSI